MWDWEEEERRSRRLGPAELASSWVLAAALLLALAVWSALQPAEAPAEPVETAQSAPANGAAILALRGIAAAAGIGPARRPLDPPPPSP
jgi:hypothetical protein